MGARCRPRGRTTSPRARPGQRTAKRRPRVRQGSTGWCRRTGIGLPSSWSPPGRPGAPPGGPAQQLPALGRQLGPALGGAASAGQERLVAGADGPLQRGDASGCGEQARVSGDQPRLSGAGGRSLYTSKQRLLPNSSADDLGRECWSGLLNPVGATPRRDRFRPRLGVGFGNRPPTLPAEPGPSWVRQQAWLRVEKAPGRGIGAPVLRGRVGLGARRGLRCSGRSPPLGRCEAGPGQGARCHGRGRKSAA